MTLSLTAVEEPAVAAAYDALAPAYDLLTSEYRHDLWLERIERLARDRGLAGRRLLDLACGTGKSFMPLLDRGYETTACDISAQMVKIARCKAPGADIRIADIRTLGSLGEFDLITCLDDAVNYLLAEDELEAFFRGVAVNLAPGGIAVFDVNSLRMYREGFARDWIVDGASAFVAWTARGAALVPSGGEVQATVHVFSPTDSGWERHDSRHRQRHWARSQILDAAQRASLRIIGAYGQHRGAVIEEHFGEGEHMKALYLATHTERS
jgi:SAM-dependent methyltransferase